MSEYKKGFGEPWYCIEINNLMAKLKQAQETIEIMSSDGYTSALKTALESKDKEIARLKEVLDKIIETGINIEICEGRKCPCCIEKNNIAKQAREK